MSKVHRWLIVIVVMLTTSLHAMELNEKPQIIPAVGKWVSGSGRLNIKSAKLITSGIESENVAQIMTVELKDITSREWQVSRSASAKGDVVLELDKAAAMPKEAYTIEVGDRVVLKASTAIGLFYASRSLLQMVAEYGDSLPKGKIIDEPAYQLRSMLLDVGRYFHPMDELKDWIRALSYFKMNEIHLHLNQGGNFRVEMKTISGLTSKDFYSQKEIRELQDFAKVRGITIIPELETPSHSSVLTALRPDLMFPHNGNYLDITNPDVYPFIEKILDEMVPLFDAPDFHIATDEYRLNHTKLSDEEKEFIGKKFTQYINHLNRYIRKHFGKNVRIWSGYEHMAGTTDPDKNVVIDMWETSDAVNKSRSGYKIINSTMLWTYLVPGVNYFKTDNVFLYDKWSPLLFSNEPGGILQAGDSNLLGGKLHIWLDTETGGPNRYEIARMSLPSVLVMAEKLWGTKGSKDFEGFARRADVILPGNDGFEFIRGSNEPHSPKNFVMGHIPNTTFLKRAIKSDENNVVWKLQGAPKTFTWDSRQELNLGADYLKCPWTAEFTVTRLADRQGGSEKRLDRNEVLLSSSSGMTTVYLNYAGKADDAKDKVTEVKKGVAIVRNWHAYTTPYVSFDYQVPLNKKTTLKFVGHHNLTELYVDGRFVGSVKNQMLCPTAYLGDGKGQATFNGILHDAVIYDNAPDPLIFTKWKANSNSQATITGVFGDPKAEASSVTIYWGDNDGGTDVKSWDHSINLGLQSGTFSTILSGLNMTSDFYYRWHVSNSNGASWAELSDIIRINQWVSLIDNFSDIDLTGNMVYALNCGSTSNITVGSLEFKGDVYQWPAAAGDTNGTSRLEWWDARYHAENPGKPVSPSPISGVTLECSDADTNGMDHGPYEGSHNFDVSSLFSGEGDDAGNLAKVLSSAGVQNLGNPGERNMVFRFDTIEGRDYKLQMLFFYNSSTKTSMDIFIRPNDITGFVGSGPSGTAVIESMDVPNDVSDKTSEGLMYTYLFTGESDGTLDIEIVRNSGGNNIGSINAITLEDLGSE